MSKLMDTVEKRDAGAIYLEAFAAQIRNGEVEWFAVSVQFENTRIALHSDGAPKRPRGMT